MKTELLKEKIFPRMEARTITNYYEDIMEVLDKNK
jgi:hypothetical protein